MSGLLLSTPFLIVCNRGFTPIMLQVSSLDEADMRVPLDCVSLMRGKRMSLEVVSKYPKEIQSGVETPDPTRFCCGYYKDRNSI